MFWTIQKGADQWSMSPEPRHRSSNENITFFNDSLLRKVIDDQQANICYQSMIIIVPLICIYNVTVTLIWRADLNTVLVFIQTAPKAWYNLGASSADIWWFRHNHAMWLIRVNAIHGCYKQVNHSFHLLRLLFFQSTLRLQYMSVIFWGIYIRI